MFRIWETFPILGIDTIRQNDISPNTELSKDAINSTTASCNSISRLIVISPIFNVKLLFNFNAVKLLSSLHELIPDEFLQYA